MTRDEYAAACAECLIDPSIAIESESVRDAIRADDMDGLRRVLREEF
jgi:hypothetical protein